MLSPRWPWVLGFSVLVLAGCWAASASTRDAWLTGELCKAHDGEKYRAELASNGMSDDCNACHSPGYARLGLRTAVPPRIDEANCMQCHEDDLEKPLDELTPPAAARSEYQKTDIAGREMRKAHLGDESWKPADFGYSPAGLQSAAGGSLTIPLRCISCHPDHQGEAYSQKRRVRGWDSPPDKSQDRVAVEAPCLACHLPASAEPDSGKVLANFIKAHTDQETFFKGSPPGSITSSVQVRTALRASGYTCGSCHGEHHRMGSPDRKENPED